MSNVSAQRQKQTRTVENVTDNFGLLFGNNIFNYHHFLRNYLFSQKSVPRKTVDRLLITQSNGDIGHIAVKRRFSVLCGQKTSFHSPPYLQGPMSHNLE